MFDAPSATALRVVFKAYLASDHVTPATGKTISISLSKNGAAFTVKGNATQIANGWYYIDLNTTDTGTVGPLIIHGMDTSPSIDPIGIVYNIKAASAGLINVNADLVDGVPPEDAAAIALATRIEMDNNSQIAADVSEIGVNGAGLTALATQASITALDAKINLIDTETDKIAAIQTKVNFLPSIAAGAAGGVAIVGSAMTLTAGERTAAATENWNLVNGIMTGFTPGRMMRLFSTTLLGKVGISGSTVNFTDVLNTPLQIVATTTADGQRTAMTLTQT